MKYAPVIIPTLNRKTHLENLINSLSRNSWAKYTDVYVSVDYPPSDKYKKGYAEVCDYLDQYEGKKLFNKFIIFKQEKNLGPSGNNAFLKKYIFEECGYDRWIGTEDDNVFAPNFLEYVDKGLEIFEKDNNIMAICGFHDLGKGFQKEIGINDNVVKQFYFVPYGYGTWKYKEDKFAAEKMDVLLNHKYDNISSIWKLYKNNQLLFCEYVYTVLCGSKYPQWKEEELLGTDCIRGIYNFFTNKSTIVPTEYKSHSEGFDGSGINMGARDINPNVEWPLDESSSFDFCFENLDRINPKVIRVLNQKNKCSFKYIIKSWMLYIVYILLGKDRNAVLRFLSIIRKN